MLVKIRVEFTVDTPVYVFVGVTPSVEYAIIR